MNFQQRCHSGEMKDPAKQEGNFRIFTFPYKRVKLSMRGVIFAFEMLIMGIL